AGREHGYRKRQVEARSRLAQVRGREVRGHALQRKLEPGVEHRGPNALARLAHGRIGKSHDGEGGQPAAEVHLDGDLARVDSLDGERGNACEHAATLDRGDAPVCELRNKFATGSCQSRYTASV